MAWRSTKKLLNELVWSLNFRLEMPLSEQLSDIKSEPVFNLMGSFSAAVERPLVGNDSWTVMQDLFGPIPRP
jgi:hypothetical protein